MFLMRVAVWSPPGELSVHLDRERCSHVHLDAVTSDDAKDVYFFRGAGFVLKNLSWTAAELEL